MGVDPISIGIMLLSTAYQAHKQAEMKKKMAAEAEKHKGFKFTQSGQAFSIPVIYGKQMVGGIVTKLKVTNSFTYAAQSGTTDFREGFNLSSQSGSKNEFLHTQYVICHEGIDSIKHVKVNNQDFDDTNAKFNHYIRARTNGGTADASATANGLPSSNLMTGCANVNGTFKLNRDEQNYNGTPELSFFVNGMKVHTINKSGNNYTLSGSKTYSNNPAYVLLDYLTNTAFGRGLALTYIDLESFYNAAQTCASIVSTGRQFGGHVNDADPITTLANLSSFPVEGEVNRLYYANNTGAYYRFQRSAPKSDTDFSGTYVSSSIGTRDIPLYECNITLDTETNFRDNIARILDTMGLAELVWSGNGTYKLLIEHPETQAELEALVDSDLVFSRDDIIRESVSIKWPTAAERLNQATVQFDNEHEDFKSDSITFPLSNSTAHSTFLTEDNNQPFKGSIEGNGVTDPYHAQALAEQAVRKARTMRSISLTVSKKGLKLEPGDFIKFNDSGVGLDSEIYRIESTQVNSDFTVKISAYLFDDEMLAWNVNDDIAYATPPTYDFTVDPVTNLTITTGAAGTNDFALAVLNWSTPHPIGYEYDIYFKRQSESDYVFLANTGATEFEINSLPNLTIGESFDFQVQARSPFGKRSNSTTVSTSGALVVVPPEVTGISVTEEQYLTNNASGLKNRAIVTWSAGTGGISTSYYKVEYKRNAETNFQVLGTIAETEVTIPDIADGVYQFRVTPYSALEFAGVATTQNKTIVGFSQDPQDPSGFSGNINEGQINLTWDAPSDLDVLYGGYSQIRFHAATDGTASWDTSSILVEKLSGNTTNKTVPTLKGTFFIRFYDAFDNFSANAVGFVSTFEDQTFNLIDTIDEDAGGFAGTKTNCSVVSGNLDLNSGQTNMLYTFANTVDLGELTTVRLVPDLDVSVTVAGITVATYSNVGNVDNFAGPLANASIQVQVRTNDSATGGTWSAWSLLTIGSYTTRRLQFRLNIITSDANTAVSVDKLHIDLDKKDIIKTGTSTSSSSGNTTVTFATPYYAGISGTVVPRVGFQVIGGNAGDNVVITSRTKTGFTFSVYNSGGSRVVRTIDYQAIGQ